MSATETAGPTASPLPEPRDPALRRMANAIRALAMDAVEKAQSGHPGMPMGMADVATVLWSKFLKFAPAHPDWPDRDRFVLSAGHGSMLLYALLHLTGFPEMTRTQLERFRQLDSKTPGHPERGHTHGVEVTTGPLAQGLADAVGMALAERLLATRFGKELVDHYTYVIAGDGCLMEGLSHEAISLAGHLRLSRLIVLWDHNSISIDGSTSLSTSDDQVARFAACGWDTQSIDGHDTDAIEAAIIHARTSDRPSFIACRTIIAFGAPTKAGTAAAHGSVLGAAEIAATRARLGWTLPPFELPDDVTAAWAEVGGRGARLEHQWRERFDAADPALLQSSLARRFERLARRRLAPHDPDGRPSASSPPRRPRSRRRQASRAWSLERPHRRCCPARTGRWLGRSHQLQQHRRRRSKNDDQPPTISPAAISTTACDEHA